MEKKKTSIILTIVAVATLIALVVGATFAYFQATGGVGVSSKINVTSYTTDILTFETGSDIAISADQESFAQGKGNASGSTFAKATLVANSKTNTATDNYNVYLNIENNEFEYTQKDKTPELLLQVTDPNGEEVTSLSSLEYKTVTDGNGQIVKGFDITSFKGLVIIANNKEINANPKTIENYDISVVFVNLDVDQSANAGKSLNAKVMIQKELLLTTYVQNLYTGTQGENNIYYHNGTILGEDGSVIDANDNSYRFAGKETFDYYTCKYDENDVVFIPFATDLDDSKTAAQQIRDSNCDNIYKVTNGNDIYYVNELSVIDTDNVKWDNDKSYCVTEKYNFPLVYIMGEDGKEYPTEETCHGEAYAMYGAGSDGVYPVYYINSSSLNFEYLGKGEEVSFTKGNTINNYVCFGSDEEECPLENLYRIIGEFDGNIKLVKYKFAAKDLLGTDGDYADAYALYNVYKLDWDDYFNTYAYSWSKNGSESSYNATGYYNDWSYSELNKVNLNTNYLKNIGDKWSNLIKMTTWYVGGVDSDDLDKETAFSMYQKEIASPAITTGITNKYNAKVGLAYVSDVLYALSSDSWNDKVLDNGSYNWMYNGVDDLLITRSNDLGWGYNTFYYLAGKYGGLNSALMTFTGTVRPTFYLNSDVTYSSGTGTKEDPIRLKLD